MSVDLKDNQPYGKLALVNNPHGNSIKALVDLGVPIGVSTRALGNVDEDFKSQFIPEEDYTLITWDFTRNPNLESAVLAPVSDSLFSSPVFKEFAQFHGIRDSFIETPPTDLLSDLLKMQSELTKLINNLKK